MSIPLELYQGHEAFTISLPNFIIAKFSIYLSARKIDSNVLMLDMTELCIFRDIFGLLTELCIFADILGLLDSQSDISMRDEDTRPFLNMRSTFVHFHVNMLK